MSPVPILAAIYYTTGPFPLVLGLVLVGFHLYYWWRARKARS